MWHIFINKTKLFHNIIIYESHIMITRYINFPLLYGVRVGLGVVLGLGLGRFVVGWGV